MIEWIVLIASIPGILFCLYHAAILLVGSLKKLPPIPHAKPVKRLAAVIPARNEAQVVGRLVESLWKQNYPRALMDVFVVPNNCTDDSEAVAKAAGAQILTCSGEIHCKGDVLRLAFEKLLKDERHFDAFVIVDADNVVDAGFFQAVNNALCAGYEVGQAYRDSKNPAGSWVASCTSIFFWFMNRLYNRSRAALGMNAALNGTGIMIGAAYLRRHGYRTQTLTEDLEVTAQCALAGEKIAWMPEAITFDEQPLTIRDSFTQRRRWAAGTRQCMTRYMGKLFKAAPGCASCFDVGMLFSSILGQVLSIIPFGYTAWRLLAGAASGSAQGRTELLGTLALCVIGFFAAGVVFAAFLCALEGKLKGHRLRAMLTMGLYLVTWVPANLIGILMRAPKWKVIPHTDAVGIDQCEAEDVQVEASERGEPS